MKRYLIFGAVGPLIGGFLLLFATTWTSGYWTETNLAEVKKLFVVFAKTLQYAYLFGIDAGADAGGDRRHPLSRQEESAGRCGC